MKNKTIYTLVIDGKEVAKDTLLSGVAIKTNKVKDHYEIRKYQKGKIVKLWGYSINNGKKIPYASHDTGNTIKKKDIVQSKLCSSIKRVSHALGVIKDEIKIRRNLKALEKKVHLWDLES